MTQRLPLKVINLWGGPGSGKSTTAAGLFNLMKIMGLRVEYVTEYPKDLTWEKNKVALEHQLSVFGQMDYRLRRLVGQVDWVITDGPLPIGIAYMGKEWEDLGLHHLMWDCYDRYENFHVHLTRGNFGYAPEGRNESEHQATTKANIIDQLFSTAIIDEEEWSLELVSTPTSARDIFNALIAPELDLDA